MLSITSVFFFAKIAIVTHLRINLHTCGVPENLVGPCCGYSKAVQMESTGYFGQRCSQAMSGLHIKL